jgi:hypothetical protein
MKIKEWMCLSNFLLILLALSITFTQAYAEDIPLKQQQHRDWTSWIWKFDDGQV